MRITLIISSLFPGGAERVMARMASYWAGQGKEITLITLHAGDEDFYRIHSDVKRVALDVMHFSKSRLVAVWTNLLLIKKLRRAILESRPDAVVSFIDLTNVYTLLATRGLKLKVVVSERVDPSQHSIPKIESCLRRLTYPWATTVVVQTERAARWVKHRMNCRQVVVLPNPSIVDEISCDTTRLADVIKDGSDKKTVVAMGRMRRQKGFDLLLKAFASCSSPEWRLVILGEGQERKGIESLIREYGLEGRVFMPGVVKYPLSLLKQADLFVMSSRYEGFPNALLEAMACRLPVISFDCPSGPGEIIRDGVDGILVPPEDVNAMAEAMKRLMADEEERKRLGTRAIEVLDRFGIEKVMKKWEELLK